MSGKLCCLPVDIYALNKTQKKALQILKTDLSLIMQMQVSWAVSPERSSLTSPRGGQSVGTAMWILASSREFIGGILEI